MGNSYQIKQISKFFLLAITLNCVSCNSYKQTSLYPMVNSIDQKKSGFRSRSLHNTEPLTRVKKDLSESVLTHTSGLHFVKKVNDSTIPHVYSIPFIHSLSSPNTDFPIPTTCNTQSTLTASLSRSPVILTRYNLIPDTSIIRDSAYVDSSLIKTTRTKPNSDYKDSESNSQKTKNRETFATISLVSGITSIISMFIIPILFIPAAIAAIVFGAMGLKSPKKKRAGIGMIIGIIMLSLLTILVLAYSGAIF